MKRILIGTLATATMSVAFAGNVTATYAGDFRKSVQFEWVYSAGTQTQATVKWNATRTGGTDTRLSSKYLAYCTEIGEFIGSSAVTHDVVDLLNSQTVFGGTTGPVTYTPTRTSNMQKLWGSFFGQTTDAEKSAAFQLAVWEIAFDNDLTLTKNASQGGKFWGVDRGAGTLDAVSTIAEGWLKDIRTGAANQSQQLLLLKSNNAQDLITPVPEPASMLALGLGLVAVTRRRKK